jgi:pimeloyl-ACP methyl ester carboxylesterase
VAVLTPRPAELPETPEKRLRERWTTVNGLRVFSRVSEEGAEPGAPPIVHVHGFGVSGRYLEPTARQLATHYPTYVPDLPGYGRSENPRRLLDIPGLAEALAGYLDAVGVERAVVLGNSMGCLTAAEFAHRFPERVERAVLVSPAGGPHNQPLWRGMGQLVRDFVKEPLSLASIAVPEYLRFGMVNSLRVFQHMCHYPTVDRLSEIPVPFLAIVGKRDPLVSVSQMTEIFRSPAVVELIYHFDCAHAINYSHPEELATVVHAYLQGRPLRELTERGDVFAYLEPDEADVGA